VGSQSCAACHADNFELHRRSPHGNSFGRVDPDLEPADGRVVHTPTRLVYSIFRQGGQLFHRESLRTDDGAEHLLTEHALDYVVGSGAHARTYLIEDSGFLAESPVTWYVSRNAWGMSPGYEANNTGFARAVYQECLECHCGRVEATDQAGTSPRITELAIGCESCHGPGAAHVREHEAGTPATSGTIINPARLSRDQVQSICARCHLHSAAQVARRGRRPIDFTPGRLLSEYRVDYGDARMPDSMRVVGHVEQLRLSLCFQQSSSLSCITCHDPHRAAGGVEAADVMRGTCLNCHRTESCRESADVRRSTHVSDDCVECHMPRTTTEVPHVAATHHRIGIHLRAESDPHVVPTSAVDLIELTAVDWLSEADRQRGVGLAYLAASRKQPHPPVSEVYRQRAVRSLESALTSGCDDPDLVAALAMALLPADPGRACALAESILAREVKDARVRIDALWIASQVRMQRRELSRAIPLLEELTSLRRQGGDSYQLAACLYALGRLDAAADAAKRAIEIRPEIPRYRELLGSIYTDLGQAAAADEQRRWAHSLAP
jgi:hypothetical protein